MVQSGSSIGLDPVMVRFGAGRLVELVLGWAVYIVHRTLILGSMVHMVFGSNSVHSFFSPFFAGLTD